MVDTIRRWNGTAWVSVYDKSTFLPRDGTLSMLGDLTLFRDPINVLHAVTKQYADNLVLNVAWKDCVHAATTTNITLSGTQTIDGFFASSGNRVLVKNQTTASENGIYTVSSGAWVRALDADSGADLAMAAVFVALGSQANTAWVLTAGTSITPGTTPQYWVQFGGSNFTQAMADPLYVKKLGDTMVGPLDIDVYSLGSDYPTVMNLTGKDQVFITFASDRNDDGIIQDRAIMMVDGSERMTFQTYTVAGGDGSISFQPRGITTLGATAGYSFSNVQFRAVSTNPQALVVAAMTSPAGVGGGYIGFYPSNYEGSLGTRQGYIGYPSNTTMTLYNADTGGISIVAAGGGNVGMVSSLGNVTFSATTSTQIMTFAVGGTTRLRVDSGGVDVTGAFTATTTGTITGALTAGSLTSNAGIVGDTIVINAPASTAGVQIRGADSAPYIGFYPAAGTPRYGYLQGIATAMKLQSENDLAFLSDNVERARFVGPALIFCKTVPSLATGGTEIYGSGTGNVGMIATTTQAASIRNIYLRHISSANATGENYLEFYSMSGTTTVFNAYIEQTGNTGIKIQNGTIVAPSDYRWKDDLGPVTGALERVMQLQPKHLRWKESGIEFEGFIAHEAQPAVPYLVNGEKDAVNDDGSIKGQGFDYGMLTPLLAAAIQELNERLTTLENR